VRWVFKLIMSTTMNHQPTLTLQSGDDFARVGFKAHAGIFKLVNAESQEMMRIIMRTILILNTRRVSASRNVLPSRPLEFLCISSAVRVIDHHADDVEIVFGCLVVIGCVDEAQSRKDLFSIGICHIFDAVKADAGEVFFEGFADAGNGREFCHGTFTRLKQNRTPLRTSGFVHRNKVIVAVCRRRL
jgi:hypothetical protein